MNISTIIFIALGALGEALFLALLIHNLVRAHQEKKADREREDSDYIIIRGKSKERVDR